MRKIASSIVACLVALALTAVVAPGPAQAVTYGSYVTSPTTSAAWVLSIYHSSSPTRAPEFICTASALNPRVIMTAAHCVQEDGFYFVRVNGAILGKGTLIPIEAIFDNSRYSQLKLVNDIALMRPLAALPLKRYPRMGTAALASRVRGTRPPPLRIYGWGMTQNLVLTKRLITASVKPRTRQAKKAFGTAFKPTLMLGAGRYNAKTDTYAGGCHGDSGGPLIATVNRVQYVVGITSFGKSGCNFRAPTVFTSVGNYRSWISMALPALSRSAVTHNRALPVNHVAPFVTGTVGLGNALTCEAGSWSSNTNSTTFTWLRGRLVVSTSQTYVMTAADANADLSCKVTATSDAGVASMSTSSVKVPGAPDATTRPLLSGLPTSGMPAPGTVASCTAPAYVQEGVSTSLSWSSSSSATVPGTLLADGASIALTEDLLRSLAGKYLVCTSRAVNSIGSETLSSGRMIPNLVTPTVSATISAPSPIQAGSVATCVVTAGSGSSVSYAWAAQVGTTSGSDFADGATLLSGTDQTYTVTSGDMTVLRGKYLVCRATASTWQGSRSDIGGKFVS